MARGSNPGYRWGLAALALALSGQLWCTGVLLLARQVESLLLAGTLASVLWFWCLWACFLGRRRAGLALTACGLALSILTTGLGLLDMLDSSGLRLTTG